MFHLTLAIADLLLVLVFTWAFLRSLWERSFRAHYTLKVILPRAMAAIAMAHFALLFGQMAIDLNNALVHAVWSQPLPGGPARLPWMDPMTKGFGMPLFQVAVRLAIQLVERARQRRALDQLAVLGRERREQIVLHAGQIHRLAGERRVLERGRAGAAGDSQRRDESSEDREEPQRLNSEARPLGACVSGT